MYRLFVMAAVMAVVACGSSASPSIVAPPPQNQVKFVVQNNNQIALAGDTLHTWVGVLVEDQDNVPFTNTHVKWTVNDDGGTVNNASTVTDANGYTYNGWRTSP